MPGSAPLRAPNQHKYTFYLCLSFDCENMEQINENSSRYCGIMSLISHYHNSIFSHKEEDWNYSAGARSKLCEILSNDHKHFQVCSIEFDRKDIDINKLVVTTLEANLHAYELQTQHPTRGFASVSEKVLLSFSLFFTASLLLNLFSFMLGSCIRSGS